MQQLRGIYPEETQRGFINREGEPMDARQEVLKQPAGTMRRTLQEALEKARENGDILELVTYANMINNLDEIITACMYAIDPKTA
jgi:hypothetical protein